MIELIRVSKAFDGKEVLKDISWTIEKGQVWQLAGPSGVGKTTLMRLLMGLETPDSGILRTPPGLRISAVFQENRLCGWLSAKENIRLAIGRALPPEDAEAALLQVLPGDCLDQPCDTLSGGMQRRAALVRALLAPSDLILLDEPFAGLDSDLIETCIRVIGRMRGERALVWVSHEGHQIVNDALVYSLPIG